MMIITSLDRLIEKETRTEQQIDLDIRRKALARVVRLRLIPFLEVPRD